MVDCNHKMAICRHRMIYGGVVRIVSRVPMRENHWPNSFFTILKPFTELLVFVSWNFYHSECFKEKLGNRHSKLSAEYTLHLCHGDFRSVEPLCTIFLSGDGLLVNWVKN